MERIATFLLAMILGGCSAPAAEADEAVYCRNGGEAQALDIYPPDKEGPGRGTILYIHGGGYTEGDKGTGFELRRAKLMTAFGFSVASINYRLAPTHRFPAQLEDAVCAIRWLEKRDGVDASWIGVMGDSAGGHLAALLGTMGGTGDILKVGAVAAFYAPLDLVEMEPDSLLPVAIAPALPDAEMRARYSPIRHVDASDPPFLLIHGKKDRFVSVAQSVRFAVRLKEAGHSPLLLALDNAGHGLVPRGGAIAPNASTVDKLLVAFFVGASAAGQSAR